MIYLTATPDNKMLDRVKQGVMTHVQLNVRPHGHPLTEPKITVLPSLLCFYVLLRCIRNNRQWLIFVPTRKLATWLSKILNVDYITSESENKESIIERFRMKKQRLLIATTILERGVTFEDIDVIVLFADHPVFDTASLIQISGRVGRSFRFPKGECLFLSKSQSVAVKSCVRKIRDANRSVFGV
jgi:competence protein ComFA